MSEKNPSENETNQEKESNAVLQNISWMGLGEPIRRYGTHFLTIALIVVVVAILSSFYVDEAEPASSQADLVATAQAIAEPTLNAATGLSPQGAAINSFESEPVIFNLTIPRFAAPNTTIPNRARVDIDFYEVQQGDSVFSIADTFGLKPETVLWGNYEILQDNPRELSVGQVLNILPTDGVYYKYNVGESLSSIADFFGIPASNIVEWPGNDLDPYETDLDNPGIADGTWLIIPGGQRESQDWGPPAITRANPAAARYYGDGYCGEVYEGAVGNGTFVWPTAATYISGYDYDPNVHPGIDIGGAEGNAIYATDSGVVVYAGWSNYGYGFLVVIDHGNGWQSAYAHLSGYSVYCGQSVQQGNVIAALGNTGNSSGAHLHFELSSSIYGKVNPWNFLIVP